MPVPVAFVASFFTIAGVFLVAWQIGLWWAGLPLLAAGIGLFFRQPWARSIASVAIFLGYIACGVFLLPVQIHSSVLSRFEVRAFLVLAVVGVLTWTYNALWSRDCSFYLKPKDDENEQNT